MGRLKCLLVGWFFVTSLVWTWSGLSFDLMTQIGSFLTLSLGLFLVFSCILYFNLTLPRRYRPNWWVISASFASAVILLVCSIGSFVGLLRKLMA